MASYLPYQSNTSNAFDGISVKNIYLNSNTHQQVLFNQDESIFNNRLVCRSGVSNPDNSCQCNGSPNSAPFNTNPKNQMASLFTPEVGSDFAEPNPSARFLMQARAPYGKREPFFNGLGECRQCH